MRTVGGYRTTEKRYSVSRRTTPPGNAELKRVMEESLRLWMSTEDSYDTVIREYHEKYQVDSIADPVAQAGQRAVAEADADNDLRLRKAVRDGQWYRDRAQTAALALLARRMVPFAAPSTKE